MAVVARGVAVSPEIVRRIQPVDASIVSDRLDLPDDRQFDLVLASNVLVYYDTFEQTLALASIAAMLKPGGVLLSNDAVLEIPEVPLRSAGSLAVPFSDRPGDGERMVWYVKTEGKMMLPVTSCQFNVRSASRDRQLEPEHWKLELELGAYR